MNNVNHFPKTLLLQRLIAILIITIGLLVLLGIAFNQQTVAAINCTGNDWMVANEDLLHGAISCYNAKVTPDNYRITFTENISLTKSTKPINNSTTGIALIIDGAGFAIDGQGNEGIRPYTIEYNNHVTIQNSTITGGSVIFSNCGGGIKNSGTLTLTNSLVSYNTSEHLGGGICNDGGILTVRTTTIRNNLATSGGGIYNDLFGTLYISNSTISDNFAIYNGGGIDTGGIYLGSKTTIIENSTIAGNATTQEDGLGGGGGISAAQAIIRNSTISNNSSTGSGGGILIWNDFYVSGTITLSNVTINENLATSGGGIKGSSSKLSIIRLDNSIIANSREGGDCYSPVLSTIIDDGHNIIEDNSCGFSDGADPMLGSLQDNGGETFTHALLSGSPAIDAGDTILPLDQRGFSRSSGNADDIGAFELFQPSDFVYLPLIQK